ncbi:MAG TPA: outer membrane protein assembly factor BamD [Blastocatellia bacterium]|nr:outer membrane protein assembly factor BamD [Blastocatellia bacterium]
MKYKSLTLTLNLALFFTLLVLAGCGKGKDTVKNDNVAAPGRDKELYEQASEKLRKGRYDEARLTYNVIISTYPDSEYLSLSKLAVADSFYLEGGSNNLEQAVAQYRDFVQYFPTHPKVCDVYLKMAEAYMRQAGAYNRDMTKANQAYFQLKAAQQKCAKSALIAQIDENLKKLEQVKGLHELDVAKTYWRRQAYKSVELRLKEADKYKAFTYRDEVLFMLGVALIEQELPEEATPYFTELVRDIPNSEFTPEAKKYLEKLGKPIPAPSNNDPAPPRPGRLEQFKLIIGKNNLNIREEGVITDRKGRIDGQEEEKRATPISDASDIRTVRSGPRKNETPAPEETAKPQNAGEATNGNGTATPPATKPEPQQTNKPEDPKKKKKRLLGIFK